MPAHPSGHRRRARFPTRRGQALVRRTEVVYRPHQVRVRLDAGGRTQQTPAAPTQARQPLPKRGIEPLDIRRGQHLLGRQQPGYLRRIARQVTDPNAQRPPRCLPFHRLRHHEVRPAEQARTPPLARALRGAKRLDQRVLIGRLPGKTAPSATKEAATLVTV